MKLTPQNIALKKALTNFHPLVTVFDQVERYRRKDPLLTRHTQSLSYTQRHQCQRISTPENCEKSV